MYKVNSNFFPEFDSGVVWNDPELNISWPISEPILSKKDENLPLLKNQESGFS